MTSTKKQAYPNCDVTSKNQIPNFPISFNRSYKTYRIFRGLDSSSAGFIVVLCPEVEGIEVDIISRDYKTSAITCCLIKLGLFRKSVLFLVSVIEFNPVPTGVAKDNKGTAYRYF